MGPMQPRKTPPLERLLGDYYDISGLDPKRPPTAGVVVVTLVVRVISSVSSFDAFWRA